MTHSVMVWPLVRHTFETFIGPLFLLKKKKKRFRINRRLLLCHEKNGQGKKKNWCLCLIQSPYGLSSATEARPPVKDELTAASRYLHVLDIK